MVKIFYKNNNIAIFKNYFNTLLKLTFRIELINNLLFIKTLNKIFIHKKNN